MPLSPENSSSPRCTDYWHRMPYYMRAPRCTVCGEIHPNGIVIEDEYLKMLRGDPYQITFQDGVKLINPPVRTPQEFLKRQTTARKARVR